MKTTRKILSILLVLAMVSALFVTGISAEGENTAYQANAYTHIAEHEGDFTDMSGKTVTYLSADGADEDTAADLMIGYGNYGDGKAPRWNFNYDKSTFFGATYTTKKNVWQVNNTPGTAAQGYAKDADGVDYREKDGVKFYLQKIYLGLEKTANAAKYFPDGIGVMPTASTSAAPEGWEYVMFNVDGYDFFYSACGMTGSAVNPAATNANRNNKVIFEVYGSPNALTSEQSADASFVLLAASQAIGASNAGEFNVDVSDYKTLKLVCRIDDANGSTKNYGCNSAWGGACVYNLNDFSVNYDGNGGKTADDKTTLADTENVTDSNEVSATITADPCTFEKEGYIFKGWNTKADGTGTTYAAGAEIALTTEAPAVTLYAQWEEKAPDITYYKVTFVADGATVSEIQVEAGKDATLPAVPEKEGYTGAWDKDGKAIAADTTITAVYTIKTYTVTFVIPEQENTTATVEHGADVTLPTAPAKAGYLVVWDHTGKGITGDITITASYKREYKTVEIKLKQDPSGMPKGASSIKYLSDLHDASDDGKNLGLNKYVIDQGNNSKIILNASYSQPAYYFIDGGRKVGNGNGVDADGYRVFTRADGSTIKIHKNDIVLGYTGTRYEKGLGVHPNTKTGADRYIVYDVSTLDVNFFYAVAGATAKGLTVIDNTSADWKDGRGVTFEVWGSTDETYNKNSTEFVKLAFVDNISGYNVGEFKVNIEGINFLKLVVKVSPDATTNDSSAVAWGNACVYKGDTSADTSDGFSMTAVAAAIVAATSVVALVVNRKKFF